MLMSEAAGFIQGLKAARSVYAECPSCSHIFSLHSARLISGKSPPKDFLSKSQKTTERALSELAEIREAFDLAKEQWNADTDQVNEDFANQLEMNDEKWRERNARLDEAWRGRLELKATQWEGREAALREQLRHLKQDVAAVQHEIIKERVTKALRSQRGVMEGHIAELFPALRKTRFNPADLCALVPTAPVDFVVMEGLFQKEVTRITFLDVKKGGASLSSVQKSIRNTIRDGNVEFKMMRVNFEAIRGTAAEESC